MKLFKQLGVFLNLSMGTFCPNIDILYPTRIVRDIDRNGRRYIHHVPINHMTRRAQLNHRTTNILAKNLPKVLTLHTVKLEKKIWSMMQLFPRWLNPKHGLNNGFILWKNIIKEIMCMRGLNCPCRQHIQVFLLHPQRGRTRLYNMLPNFLYHSWVT